MTKAETQLYLVNCVDEPRPNLAVTRLEPGAGTRAAGVPLFMQVEVRLIGTLLVIEMGSRDGARQSLAPLADTLAKLRTPEPAAR
jgi:hypothetical protein